MLQWNSKTKNLLNSKSGYILYLTEKKMIDIMITSSINPIFHNKITAFYMDPSS